MASAASALHTAMIAAMEAALNRALRLDPAAEKAMVELEGQVFHLHCTRPVLELYLLPWSRGVRLLGFWEGEVTTAIAGQATDFTELAGSSDPAATLVNGNLELRGDSAALLQLQTVLSKLDPDWEAPLVEAFGDVAGHQLARVFRGMFGWGRQAASSFSRQLQEFIVEEAGLIPPRREVEDFYQDINELVMRFERLQTQLGTLARRMERLK